jgi:nucleoside-diphosphate-sugar epimerase
MKKALVTGGAGFVGRHLTKKLLDNRWEVSVVDSIESGSGAISPNIGWPLFEPRDYNNFTFTQIDCRNYFKQNPNQEYDYVFHLAAMVGGRATIENNPLLVSTDLAIDSDMWKWATTSKISKIVNFSSSAVYPVNLQTSMSDFVMLKEDMVSFENSLGLPDLTYGWAKLTSEYLGKIAWEKYGIKSVVFRPFSGYGPDQDLSYPFPSICQRAIENVNSEKFMIWGSGNQSRDFIHIEDCIRGVLLLLDLVNDGDAINLSTGIATTFIDFAKTATGNLGYNPDILGDDSKPTGVNSRVGDTSKQKGYGFEASITFQEGIDECLRYLERKKSLK